jgi:hypothetical protein
LTILKPETVQIWGREAQDLEISEARATVIAKFVDNIAMIVRAAGPPIPFDSEPADFVSALHRWKAGADDRPK